MGSANPMAGPVGSVRVFLGGCPKSKRACLTLADALVTNTPLPRHKFLSTLRSDIPDSSCVCGLCTGLRLRTFAGGENRDFATKKSGLVWYCETIVAVSGISNPNSKPKTW